MHFTSLFTTSLLASATLAQQRSPAHVRKDSKHQVPERHPRAPKVEARGPPSYGGTTDNSTIIPQNANTTKFAVNGTGLPFVNFDIGESYAGLLPISEKANSSEL